MIYLDFTKAFDNVQHDVFVSKLSKHDLYVRWDYHWGGGGDFHSISAVCCPTEKASEGIPQASIVSLLLFNVRIKILDERIESTLVNMCRSHQAGRGLSGTLEGRIRSKIDLHKLEK